MSETTQKLLARIAKAGQIIGLVSLCSAEEWSEATKVEGLAPEYARHIELIAELRKALTAGGAGQ